MAIIHLSHQYCRRCNPPGRSGSRYSRANLSVHMDDEVVRTVGACGKPVRDHTFPAEEKSRSHLSQGHTMVFDEENGWFSRAWGKSADDVPVLIRDEVGKLLPCFTRVPSSRPTRRPDFVYQLSLIRMRYIYWSVMHSVVCQTGSGGLWIRAQDIPDGANGGRRGQVSILSAWRRSEEAKKLTDLSIC
jgi:hypothetical protein